MKKIFNIIKVGDYLYAVDKEAKIKAGDTFVIGNLEQDNHKFEVAEERHLIYINGLKEIMESDKLSEQVRVKVKTLKIVATNNPSLKGVLQLPSVEEDIEIDREKLAKIVMTYPNYLLSSANAVCVKKRDIPNIIKEYNKAAQSKGQHEIVSVTLQLGEEGKPIKALKYHYERNLD